VDCLLDSLAPTDAIQDEPFRRIEVITGVARRRRWPEQDKARLAAESLEPGVVVADVARRYGLHRNQLYGWRSAFGVQPDRTEEARKAPAFRSRSYRRRRSLAASSRSSSDPSRSGSPAPSTRPPCARFAR
jgi:transposase-like protein